MSLEATRTDIISRLRQGRFQNEQAVSQGIILPILRELGWVARRNQPQQHPEKDDYQSRHGSWRAVLRQGCYCGVLTR